ncbi:MAG: aromatic ring-hydroxylating dioxygenase subunit alpha [Sphingomonadales bacterium]|nr:aromatic ring-hydroxylating dioxygenase subunit alpha [Sphingomonadales bacterium]
MTAQTSFTMLTPEDAAKLRGTGPVTSAPYWDPAWWELERKAIFMRTWLHIGHVCEIPEAGCFIRRDIDFARASLLIVRGKDNAIRAFHNACTHRGTQLTQETCGKRAAFSCPYHMWTFGGDGRLLSAPDFEQFHIGKDDVGLKAVACEVVAGMIFINLDREPPQSLREFLGPIADEMETLPVAHAVDFTEWTYEVDANWKTNFDNFQENYHLRFVHPSACNQATGPDNPMGYPTHYGFSGPHRSQTLWRNPDPPPPPQALVQGMTPGHVLAARDGLDFAKVDFKLFPCLHIVSLPPAQQWSHTHWPLGPGRTRGIVRMYWTKRPDSVSRLYFQEFGAMVLRDLLTEDRFAVRSAQRGLASGAVQQIHLQDHEMLLRHMYEEVQGRVAAYLAECEAKGVTA